MPRPSRRRKRTERRGRQGPGTMQRRASGNRVRKPEVPVQGNVRAMSMPHVTTPPSEGLQRLLDEGRFVRMLARTLIADEADEVVQLTWLRAIQHGGGDVAEPRSWLARIVRNVAANVRRRRARRRHHETEAAACMLVPSSADLAVREEQRRILVAAVDGLPARLRAVVLLRYFEGLPPRRIAAELGIPVTAAWNRLREGLQVLRK